MNEKEKNAPKINKQKHSGLGYEAKKNKINK